MKRVTIGIDYDGTFDTDPVMWRQFCAMARSRGHTVVVVTYRHKNEGRTEEFAAACGETPVVFVSDMFGGATWKHEAAKAAGYEVDIWIDDMPATIMPGVVLIGG